MGSQQSQHSSSPDVYDISTDPCSVHLDAYLACVEKKKDGLREGDECAEQSNTYKLCRLEQKKNSKQVDKE